MTLGRALLHPRSVAVIGASDDATKTTGRPLRFLRAGGVRGQGLSGQSEPRDGAGRDRVAVGGSAARDPRACLHRDANGACARRPGTLWARGGGGGDGACRGIQRGGRRGPRARAGAAPHRLGHGHPRGGPVILGVANMRDGMLLTANAAFAEPDLPQGHDLRRLAQRHDDRLAALARQGARHGLRGLRIGGKRGGPLGGRDLRRDAGRSADHRLPALPRDSPPTPTSCARSRWPRRSGDARHRLQAGAFGSGRPSSP